MANKSTGTRFRFLESNLRLKLILLFFLTASCGAEFLALLLSGPGGLPIVAAFIVPGARQLVATSSHPLVRFFSEPQIVAVTHDDCDISPKAYVTNLRSNSVSVIDVLRDRVIATIPVGRNPFAIAITPDCSKAYVGNFGNRFDAGNTVSVIDIKTDEVIDTLTVGRNPGAIAITPDGSKAYVANSGFSSSDDTVSVIDVATDMVTTINVGINPGAIAITPDGSKVYVTNSVSSTVSVIDGEKDEVTNTINVGFEPSGIAITPNGSRAYVANNSSDTVSVIDLSKDKVIDIDPTTPEVDPINVGVEPLVVEITPDGSKVYVTNLSSDSVSVIDVSSNKVRKTLPVGNIPVAIGITPNGTRAYIGNCNCGIADPHQPDTVSVIDVVDDELIDVNPATPEIDSIPVGFGPLGLAITPDGSKIYVPNSNSSTVSVIDVSNNTVSATIPVGSGPAFVVITPDDTKVYVSNYDNADNPGDTISVINGATDTVIREITVGMGPAGMAITPDGSNLYVANFGSISNPGNTVSVINVASDTVIDEIDVETGPIDIAITPDGSKVYVANFGSSNSLGNTVSVINVASNTVTEQAGLGVFGFGPAGVAVTPDGSKVYVANLGGVNDPPNSQAGKTVSVINVTTDTLAAIANLNCIIGTENVPCGPLDVDITPDNSTAYVTNFGTITFLSNFDAGNEVSLIDVTTNGVVDRVNIGVEPARVGPAGIAITPDGSTVYVSNLDVVRKESNGQISLSEPGDTISVIDARTNQVVATIAVGNRPLGVAVTHDGTKAYVANYFSNTVSVIDVQKSVTEPNDAVIDTISLHAENQVLATSSGN